MTRKLVHALLALTVLAIASLVWAQPAQAAPGGACSVEEWKNPANAFDCARRLGQSFSDKTGCVTAPAPNSPTAGMAGWFTSQPDSSLRDGVQGMYSRYGVGGYGLDTYDIGCLGTLRYPGLTSSNMIASGEFQAATSFMAASHGLRELAYDPARVWSWTNGFLESTAAAAYKYIFNPIGAITLAAIGLFVLTRARGGQMSQVMKITGWAVFVTFTVTALAHWPVSAANGADAVTLKGLTVVHSILGPAPQDVPADQCGRLTSDPAACKDNRSVATRSADVVTEAVLYQSWLRAVLGDSDSPTAVKYGPALYDATTLSWGEAARADQNPTLRQQLIEDKANAFNAIAQQIRTEDPVAYEYLQGKHGSDRVGAGLIALLSAIAFAAYDMAASVVILFGFGVFRAAILFAPLLGTVGIFLYTSSGFRRLMHATAAAAVNIVVFGAASGVYLLAVDAIFRKSDMAGWMRLLSVILTGLACWLLTHPVRRFIHTATGRARTEDGISKRAIAAGRSIREDNRQQPYEVGVDAPPAGPATDDDIPTRPETASRQRRAAVGHVARAVAPTFTGIPNNATYTNTRDAVREAAGTARPETGRIGAARAVATAAFTAAANRRTVESEPKRPETRS